MCSDDKRRRLPLGGLAAGERDLDADSARYLVAVLRLRAGDAIVAFDADLGVEAGGVIVYADHPATCRVRFDAPRPSENVAPFPLTIIQGYGKGDRPDQVVRDACALGATHLLFALTERSVAKPSTQKNLRWEKIAVETARQSGRGDRLRVQGPVPLQEALTGLEPSGGPRLCLDPRASEPLGRVLQRWPGPIAPILLVGPEGGLTPGELEAAMAEGFTPVSLGRFTLRTETACTAALGAVAAWADLPEAGSD